MYKTCKHLEESLYIAPNEIRACCQRFFYKGKLRGDAKLIDIVDGKTPTTEDLLNSRNKVFEEIQNDKKEECLGCPLLRKVDQKPKINSKIKFLSIEHHSVCNLRCSYCSEVYYGGVRSKYNIVEFISYLSKNNSLDSCYQVVWGGGEPTLDKSFEQILEAIEKHANPNIYHRVFTNSSRFSPAIKKYLEKNLIKIVTSIDAGTAEVFQKVRGRSKLKEVLENLKIYSSVDSSKITIKYIFTNDNSDYEELDKFIENLVQYNLLNCNFQISFDYKKDKIDLIRLKSICYLFGKLIQQGCKRIFLDDHVVSRFVTLDQKSVNEIKDFLKIHSMEDVIIDNLKEKDLIIFGAGRISAEIIEKANFFKQLDNFHIVDSDPSKVGELFKGNKIMSIDFLKENNHRVYIGAAQSYDDIFKTIQNIKGNTESVINGVLI
jgi:wyosine [tRNA(Phe)-imidazoG37] synthetase (radical SAM superfamily)